MKVTTNYSINTLDNRQKVAFSSNSLEEMPVIENNSIEKNQNSIETSNDIRDYKINLPVKYNFIESIDLPNGLSAKYYKLSNGQKVVIIPKKGPTVVKTYVNTGSMNEPDNLRGISHFIEHNLFNGSEDLQDKVFFDEVHKMGANTNASTTLASTDYYIESNLLNKNDLENEIKLHSAMMQTPKFLNEKLEKEKDIVNSEINMCLSDNENIGFTSTLKNLFNIKTNSQDLVAGTTDNITNITRDDVVDYFNTNYYPANMVTVISGNVNENDAISLVSKYFNSNKIPQNERNYEKFEPITSSIRNDIISQKTISNQSSIFIGFSGPQNNQTKDKISLDALFVLMGGLNNSRNSATEKDFCTNIFMSNERIGTRQTDPTMILVNADTTEENSEKLLNEIYSNLNNIIQEPPTMEEMDAIKNKLRKNYENIFECSQSLNSALGMAFLDGEQNSINKTSEIIDNLTPEDIVNCAKKYINLNKASVTIIHPKFATKESIEKNYSTSLTDFNNIINPKNVKRYLMNNNINATFNNINSNNANLIFSLKAYGMTPKKAALSDILSLILNREGVNKEELAQRDKYAIDPYFLVKNDSLKVLCDYPVQNNKQALELINTKFNSPNITDETVQASIQKLSDKYKMKEANAVELFSKATKKNYFTTEEKLNSLKNITTKDVQEFYSDLLSNSQALLTVSAPFEKNTEISNQILDNFSQYPQVKPFSFEPEKKYSSIPKSEVLTNINNKNQSEIIEGFNYKYSGNIKDINCVDLLNCILGGTASSRLFNDLREKRHLAYSVNSNTSRQGDNGILTLKIKTTTQNLETGEKTLDNVQKSIVGFNENIERLLKEKVTQEELENAKKVLKNDILSTETNFEKTNLLDKSFNSYYGLDYYNEKLKNLDEITPDDIFNTAKNIFSSKPIYALTGTQETLDYNKEFLESLK